MESEAIGSSKAAETVEYAREILRNLGVPVGVATLISTDNLSNQKVGSGLGCPSRSRHFLRRYAVLKQRIAEGAVTLRHIPDPQMFRRISRAYSTVSAAFDEPIASDSMLESTIKEIFFV